MTEIDREEFMTAKTEWDPSKLDDIEGASDLSIRQFPPTPVDATESFYNSRGNICPTKSDLKDDSVVSDASSKNGENKRVGHRPKPKKEKKKKKRKWVNNQKLKWKDQMKTPIFPTYLLPSKSDPLIEGVPTAIVAELQPYADHIRVQGMEHIDDVVYYDSNSDGDNDNVDDDDTFHDAIQVEDVIEDSNDDDDIINGEPINNEFLPPVGQENGATVVTLKYEGVLYTQYYSCNHGELYYQSCKIYGDDPVETEEAMNRMVRSSKLWSLCGNASSFLDNPMFHFELKYE